MFDDQNNNAVTPPDNLPSEPVDMFTGVDNTNLPGEEGGAEELKTPPNAIEAGMLKKKTPIEPKEDYAVEKNGPASIQAMPVQEVYKMKEPILGKIIITLVVLVVLGGLGFAGWWGYNKYVVEGNNGSAQKNNTNTTPVTNNENNNTPVVNNEQPVNNNTQPSTDNIAADINNDKILFGDPIDTDKDGLDDVREKELGTDPGKADTDNDGLNDSDEVIIWKTDPLKADTDGDTFEDGHEIRNGYSPTGPGKLNLVVEDPSSTPANK